MRGFPKFINSRQDLENVKVEFPQETKAFVQDVLVHKDVWVMTSKLADGEAGLTDDTHKIVENRDQITDEVTERYQYEFMEDPSINSPIKRFKFNSGAEMSDFVKGL
jgi:hypothetical protein